MTIRAHLRNNDTDPDHPPKSDLVRWGVRDASRERRRAPEERVSRRAKEGGTGGRRDSLRPGAAADARNARFNKHLQRGSDASGREVWRGTWADVRWRMSERFKADHNGDSGFECLSCKAQYQLRSDMERHLISQKGIKDHPTEEHLRSWGLASAKAKHMQLKSGSSLPGAVPSAEAFMKTWKHDGGKPGNVDRPAAEAFIKAWMARQPDITITSQTFQQVITDMETHLNMSRMQLCNLFGTPDAFLQFLKTGALLAKAALQRASGTVSYNKTVRLWTGAGAKFKKDPRSLARAKALAAPPVTEDPRQRAQPKAAGQVLARAAAKAFVRPSPKQKAQPQIVLPQISVPPDFAATAAALASETRLDDCDTDGYFLPMMLGGHKVLVEEATNTWRLDNTLLKAKTDGLGYRNSKKMDDHVGEGIFAKWGHLLTGCDEGDGWIAVRSDAFVKPNADQVEKLWKARSSAVNQKIVPKPPPKFRLPADLQAAQKKTGAADQNEEPLPYPWQLIEGDGDPYFFNEVTGSTQWNRPAA